MRSRDSLALIPLMALAAVLRLGWPGVNQFSFDQARLSLLALQMARHGQLIELGLPSSTGVPNFPAAVWFFALPYRLSTDPLFASLFVGLVATASVAGVWWLAHEAWGTGGAICATGLYATAPYAVFYSRDIWGQDLLPPIAVLWAISGVQGITRRNEWLLGLNFFLAGLAFQIHYAGITLLLPTAWLIIRYRLWRRWRAWSGGGALTALCAAPTINCCAAEMWSTLKDTGQLPGHLDWSAIAGLIKLGMNREWEWLWLGTNWHWAPLTAILLQSASFLTGLMVITGLIVAARYGRSESESGKLIARLIPFWALSSTIIFFYHQTPVYIQYHLAALPALCLAAGACLKLSTRRAHTAGWCGVALIIALIYTHAVAQTLDHVGRQASLNGIGTPLQWPRAAAARVKDGQPVIVHAHGDQAAFVGDVAACEVLFWNYPHRVVDGRSVLLLPGQEPAHLFFTFPDLPAAEVASRLPIEAPYQSLPRRSGEPPYVTLTITSALQPTSLHLSTSPELANGVQLRDWQVWPLNSNRWRFAVWWTVTANLVNGDYHQFNHLYADHQTEPGAIKDIALSSTTWQSGDNLIAWVDFDSPAQGEAQPEDASFYVEIGMYTWPQMERVPLAHQPQSTTIRLGPITLPPTIAP